MKNVIFDLDDTLWPLNARACELAGIDIEKLTTFRVHENTNLTREEQDRLYSIYCDPELWRDITYSPGAKDIYKLERHKDTKVFINSNCLNDAVYSLKRSFLSKDFKLPEDQIHLQVSSKKKDIKDAFIFVDDSPDNILHAESKFYIIPDRPWNKGIKGKNIFRAYSFGEIYDLIENILKEYDE